MYNHQWHHHPHPSPPPSPPPPHHHHNQYHHHQDDEGSVVQFGNSLQLAELDKHSSKRAEHQTSLRFWNIIILCSIMAVTTEGWGGGALRAVASIFFCCIAYRRSYIVHRYSTRSEQRNPLLFRTNSTKPLLTPSLS